MSATLLHIDEPNSQDADWAVWFAAMGTPAEYPWVVHLVAHRVTDLSDLLASIGHRDAIVPAPHGRGDELRHGSSNTIKLQAREFR